MDVIRLRLANQHLTGRLLDEPADVVRALGAVQAQDYAGAKWAIGMRTRAGTDADVERAVAQGKILRTHVLRPTWHFVLPSDIRWMLSLTAPRIAQAMSSYNRKFGLAPALLRKSNRIIERALRDGNHLTRTELRAEIARAGLIDLSGQLVGHMMMHAELDRVICSGPCRGKQFTYALLDERVPATADIDRDEALSRLAERYFPARGPASVHDFAWWSGLSMADARRAVEIRGRALTAVQVAETKMWMVERDEPAPPPSGVAHLLPNYDEYFIGFKDRSSIGRRAGTALVTGGSALINHILTIGGEIVGGWKRATSSNRTDVDLALLVSLAPRERTQLEKARARFEAFVGHEVVISPRRRPAVPRKGLAWGKDRQA